MNKKKILVVLGGNSREREISLKTGKACIVAIKKLGYKVKIFDPKKKSFFDIKRSNSDIIFNALHGEEGKMVMHKVFLNTLKFFILIQVYYRQ